MEELIAEAFKVAFLGLSAVALEFLRRFVSATDEKKHQNTLHRALMTGAAMALETGPISMADFENVAIEYAKRGAADAIKYFGLDDDHLIDMAIAKKVELETFGVTQNL